MFFKKKNLKLKTKSRTFKLLSTFFLLLVLLVGLYLVKQNQNLNSSAAKISCLEFSDEEKACKDRGCTWTAGTTVIETEKFNCKTGDCGTQNGCTLKETTKPGKPRGCYIDGSLSGINSSSLCKAEGGSWSNGTSTVVRTCEGRYSIKTTKKVGSKCTGNPVVYDPASPSEKCTKDGGTWDTATKKCMYGGGGGKLARPNLGWFDPLKACKKIGGTEIIAGSSCVNRLGPDTDKDPDINPDVIEYVSRGTVRGCALNADGSCKGYLTGGTVTYACCVSKVGLEGTRTATCTGKVDYTVNGDVKSGTTASVDGKKVEIKTSGTVTFTNLKCLENASSSCLDKSFEGIGNPPLNISSTTQDCSIKGDDPKNKYYCCK